MTCALHVSFDESLTGYDLGVLGADGVSLHRPVPATDAELELVHDRRRPPPSRERSGQAR